MLNDLLSTLAKSAFKASRPWLVVLALVLATGLSAVGTAKPSDESRAPSTQPSTELLKDIDPAPVASAEPEIKHRVVVMEVTAYCACKKCCGPNAQGITASGKYIDYNNGKFVAADTSVLPFGTKLLIPGYDAQPVEVIDRGGAIKGNKLDVFYASHEEALQWGRQKIEVKVMQ